MQTCKHVVILTIVRFLLLHFIYETEYIYWNKITLLCKIFVF
jgi:hypothetical protein